VFTEGALGHSEQSYLLFSDIIGNQMHRWDAEQGLRSFRQPSQMANGNAWDREGRLLTCEHASSRVTRTEPDGSITVLASHFEGRALNSPNDIVQLFAIGTCKLNRDGRSGPARGGEERSHFWALSLPGQGGA